MVTESDFDLHVFRSSKFRSVVNEALEFFTRTPVHELPPQGRFFGGGVYALYYRGNYEHYLPISRINGENCIQPIYVGKAVPPGWRTARARESTTPDLCHRLQEHARSIRQVSDIALKDFCCRFMFLTQEESDLVVPVEAEMIRRWRPLWNTVVDGFGNHDPGAGRYNQARSEWDILHPGRTWASRLTGKSPVLENILERVKKFLS